jgi:competence protein ComFC
MPTSYNYLLGLWSDLMHVLLPDLCICCETRPKSRPSAFCVPCLHEMPYTDHFDVPENKISQLFPGRCDVRNGAALLRFREGSLVQSMLHRLKYEGQREVAEVFGALAGEKMWNSEIFTRPDIIIPVPLHKAKLRRRGYNQSAVFGSALGAATNTEMSDSILLKIRQNASQTGKSRQERSDNVANAYQLASASSITGKHILLVDDVVTTGATLEACCHTLQLGQPASVSIICLALAE